MDSNAEEKLLTGTLMLADSVVLTGGTEPVFSGAGKVINCALPGQGQLEHPDIQRDEIRVDQSSDFLDQNHPVWGIAFLKPSWRSLPKYFVVLLKASIVRKPSSSYHIYDKL